MGPQTQTENYHTTPVDEGMAQRLSAALIRAGAIVPEDLELKMRAVDTALRRFAMNSALWYSDTPEARATLQSHLAFTLFVPAGRADKARVAVGNLRKTGLIPFKVADGDSTASVSINVYGLISGDVRFPKQKADRLARALMEWDNTIIPSIRHILEQRSLAIRHDMVQQTIVGYGDKAAAHFMRNTGIMGGMDAIPIIDVHIKKLLTGLGLVTGNPKYGTWADQFSFCARMLGMPPLLLDAIVWQAYAQNWDLEHSDFDNFGSNYTPLNTGTST